MWIHTTVHTAWKTCLPVRPCSVECDAQNAGSAQFVPALWHPALRTPVPRNKHIILLVATADGVPKVAGQCIQHYSTSSSSSTAARLFPTENGYVWTCFGAVVGWLLCPVAPPMAGCFFFVQGLASSGRQEADKPEQLITEIVSLERESQPRQRMMAMLEAFRSWAVLLDQVSDGISPAKS